MGHGSEHVEFGELSFDLAYDFRLEIRCDSAAMRFLEGNGEPAPSYNMRLIGQSSGEAMSASERLEWQHLLSMTSVDNWEEAPGQGSPSVDFNNVTFGGDGMMATYVRPHGASWVDRGALTNAFAGVIR
jgi:hypothetical protein